MPIQYIYYNFPPYPNLSILKIYKWGQIYSTEMAKENFHKHFTFLIPWLLKLF